MKVGKLFQHVGFYYYYFFNKRSLSKHLKGHSGLRSRQVFDSDTNQVFDPEWSSPNDPAQSLENVGFLKEYIFITVLSPPLPSQQEPSVSRRSYNSVSLSGPSSLSPRRNKIVCRNQFCVKIPCALHSLKLAVSFHSHPF